MNERLATSTSPYLRAHAGNPVAWFPWGEEAFAEARRRDVPVLVSIGYSTCHWCHVMARESFAGCRDRRRPQRGLRRDQGRPGGASRGRRRLHGGRGGLHAEPRLAAHGLRDARGPAVLRGHLLPARTPLGMPAFRQVLAAVSEAWTERREQIDGTADAVVSALAEVRAQSAAEPAAAHGRRPGRGGRGAGRARGPRVRRLRRGRSGRAEVPRRDRAALPAGAGRARARRRSTSAVADRALAAMAASPLRDPVEGGFFRYATRRDWSVPHYERMLTDNAQLLDVALDAGDADTAQGIAGFLLRGAAAAGRRVRRGAGLGIVDRRRAQRGRLLRAGCRGPRRASSRRPSTARSSPDGTDSPSARSPARGRGSAGRAGSMRRERRRRRCSASTSPRTAGSCARRSTGSASPRVGDARRLRAARRRTRGARRRDGRCLRTRCARGRWSTACRTADGAATLPGGGDPTLAAQGVGGSGCRVRRATSPRASPRSPTPRRRCGCSARGRPIAPSPSGSSTTHAAAALRAAPRARRAAARRGGARGAAAAARRRRRTTSRIRSWRRRAGIPADVVAIVSTAQAVAVGRGRILAVRREVDARRRGDGVRLPRLRLPAPGHRRGRPRPLSYTQLCIQLCSRQKS